MIKQIIRSVFNLLGLEISKKKKQESYIRNPEMISGLSRVSVLNLPIKTIVDVGAAQGSWSLSAKEFWPDCNFVLFEPLQERKIELEILAKQNPGFHIINSAAGKNKESIKYFVSNDLDGSGVADQSKVVNENEVRVVDVTRIDAEIKQLQLKGGYLVKLDTHGFELPILEGCEEILNDVSLFVIECYGFQIAKNSLLFWEMCRHMETLGFRLIDLVDVMHRPRDGAFWQCDAFFIRKENPIFNNKEYH
jgi:FkbM family methyltransferase